MGIFRRIKRLFERQPDVSASPPDQPVSGREPSLPQEPTNLTGMEVLLGGDKAIQHLIEMLGDDDPRKRERAARRLKQAGYEDPYPQIEAVLAQRSTLLFATGDNVKMIRAAGRLRDRRAVDLLIRIIEPGRFTYNAIRRAVVQALGTSGDVRAIETLRHEALRFAELGREEGIQRKAAVESLKRLGDEGFYAHVIRLSGLEDDNNRHFVATRVLGILGDRRAVPVLLERLAVLDLTPNQPQLYRAYAIIDALGELGDPRAVEPLIPLIKPHGRVNEHAITALGKLGDTRAVEPILTAIQGLYQMSSRIIEALGQLRDPRAVDVLVEVLQKGWTRAEAALALGKIGGEKAVMALLSVLKDKDAEIRKDVVLALGELYATDPRIPPIIFHALDDRSQEVRRNAVKTLGNNRVQEAVETLRVMLNQDKPQVRNAAAAALKRIGTSEALQAVQGYQRPRREY